MIYSDTPFGDIFTEYVRTEDIQTGDLIVAHDEGNVYLGRVSHPLDCSCDDLKHFNTGAIWADAIGYEISFPFAVVTDGRTELVTKIAGGHPINFREAR